METVAASSANATVTDYRKGSPTYGKEVTVKYDIPSFEIVSNFNEATDKFSKEQIVSMAQSRQKATANSAARQKAVAEYAATGEDLARENTIKGFMAFRESVGKPVTREEAEQHVAALLA